MPLVRIDAVEGRNESEVKLLLDAVHRAIVNALDVPESDRYQLYVPHQAKHMVVQDTGLGISRCKSAVIVTVFSKKRDENLKLALYKEITVHLQAKAGVSPEDVIICVIENGAADWSFGYGEAQYVTGKLK